MSSNFPTSLDTTTQLKNTWVDSDPVQTVHPATHNNLSDSVIALETKVGADSSAVTTTHDYKLGEVTGSDKAVGKAAAQTLTNKTLTTPVINGTITGTTVIPIANGGTSQTTKAAGFDALSPMTTQGDIIYGGASGTGTRLAKGTGTQQLRMNAGATAPEWFTPVTSALAVQVGTSTTTSLTTTAGQVVVVTAKFSYVNSTGSDKAIYLKYNGVQKDVTTVSNGVKTSVVLQYTETPGAATANVTIEPDGGTTGDVVVMILKI